MGALGKNLIILKSKRLVFSQPIVFERKTRLEPTMLAGISRELYLHPQPLEGVSGVASCES